MCKFLRKSNKICKEKGIQEGLIKFLITLQIKHQLSSKSSNSHPPLILLPIFKPIHLLPILVKIINKDKELTIISQSNNLTPKDKNLCKNSILIIL